jgi:hypothetical protein
MALKRLDEEFDLKPGTQLLPYMKRLLPSLEGRFQNLESTQGILAGINEEIRAAALLRMNEILIPATEDILEVTKMGFLLAPVAGLMEIALGYMTFQIEPGVQQDTFTPSPYLLIEHTADDYGIMRLISYDQALGILEVTVTAVHGNPGPWDDWMVSSTPGMADSTKLYHDAVAPMHTEVVSDYNEIVVMHQEILDAIEALEGAGLDLFNYVRRDGETPFLAPQPGEHPDVSSNDRMLATTGWTRARIAEYMSNAVNRAGDTMVGMLNVQPPTAPSHAATKQYVDAVLGSGGTINSNVTINTVNPTLRLKPTGTSQGNYIEGINQDNLQRWRMALGDASAERNFSLARYSDVGSLLDMPLTIQRSNGTAIFAGALSVAGAANFLAAYASTAAAAENSTHIANTAWVRSFVTAHVAGYAQPYNANLFAGIPINASGNGYWTTAADSQKCMAFSGVVYINSAVHPVGTVITFVGYGGAMTIVCSGATMYWISPSGLTSGNRVLPDRGIATAFRTQDGNWVIGGTGLT